MTRRIPVLRVLIGLVLLAGVLLVVRYARTSTTAANAPPPTPPAAALTGFDLVAADSSGTVVGSRRGDVYLGYDAAGRRQWRQQLSSALFTSCLARCPDLVISGTLDSANSPELPDPDVRWRSGDSVVRESSGVAGKPGRKTVYAAQSQQLAVLAEGDLAGNYRIEFRDRPRRSLLIPVGGPALAVKVETDAGLTHAFALETQPASPDASVTPKATLRWFVRDASGWKAIGKPTTTPYESGCIGADGRAVLSSGTVSLLVPFGGRTGIRLAGGGSCDINRLGPVLNITSVAASPNADEAQRTEVAQFDRAGKRIWSVTVPLLGHVSTTPDSALVAIAGNGRYQVRDQSGRIAADGAASDAAVINGARIVTVDGAGRPHTVTR